MNYLEFSAVKAQLDIVLSLELVEGWFFPAEEDGEGFFETNGLYFS